MNQIKGIKSQSKKIYPSAIKKREGGKWVKIKVNKVGEKEGKGSPELWLNCYWSPLLPIHFNITLQAWPHSNLNCLTCLEFVSVYLSWVDWLTEFWLCMLNYDFSVS